MLEPITVAKFGGSALGVNGSTIDKIVERIIQIKNNSKVIGVFSAPVVEYKGKTFSMTDIAIKIGKRYADSEAEDLEIIYEVYKNISEKYVDRRFKNSVDSIIDSFYKKTIISLKNVAENRRFVDVNRSRVLAYTGELMMSYIMDYILQSNDIKSNHIEFDKWPIITDDNFEAANFLLDESRRRMPNVIDLINNHDVVVIGGFIGKTIDGLETTYERGGSDRTAADIAILLNDHFSVKLDYEKDKAVLSADPKIVKDNLDHIKYLSYNEARQAGMFGMKILDPIAIKEIDDHNLNIPIIITEISNPSKVTIIEKTPPFSDDENLVKIVTGKRNCAIVRMESISSLYASAGLERDKQYHDFIKLSPYKREDVEITRLLFLDADYVRRNEKHFKAYWNKTEIVYERGVVTLIGDMMWKIPNIASIASRMVGEHGINILNLDAQEETSRILIVVEDNGTNIHEAIKAIHSHRGITRDGVK